MLILDGDVVVDPLDIGAMFSAIHSDPESVWTAPVRIWPVSTHRQDWVWAHWDESASQVNDENPRWFSFCFTYLPGELLNAAIKKGMKGWTWPRVDSTLSKAAQQRGIKVRVVENCWPKHMHW
jgi:hypothetical protein